MSRRGAAIRPAECLGKQVVTHDGESLGEVLDVALYNFSRVKELLVETATGVMNIDGEMVERIEADRILLKNVPAINE